MSELAAWGCLAAVEGTRRALGTTAAVAVLLGLALGMEEVFFFELAGLGTTFFIETGDFRFDVDFFGAATCFLAATFFDEVFFEVPFLLDLPADFPVFFAAAFLGDAAFFAGALFLAEAVFFPEPAFFVDPALDDRAF